MEETHVVTCFLRNRGEILLLERSEAVGSYAGRWGAVSGHAEGDPDARGRTASSEPSLADTREDAAAREEIAEETGLLSVCALVRTGDPVRVLDADLGTRWVVHPYLFDCERRDAETNWETDDAEWVPPAEVLRRETVPELWTAYERVAPTVESVREDADHGSAYLSVRALEVLRDRAGSFAESASRRALGEGGDFEDEAGRESDGWSRLTTLADGLLEARPSMAALGNRVNRAMATASDDASGVRPRTPEAVERAAKEGIERAFRTDEEAAENAADEIRGEVVLTLSRSGTVLDALGAADRVFVAESRPAREGVGVAETLAAEVDVTLHTDAAVAHVLATADVDAVLVGADAILPDGRVVNKTGTRGAALAANREGIPFYAVAASDKVRTDDEVHLEDGPPEAVYDDADGDADADLRVLNPTFDVTPADLVSGAITERGVLDEDGILEVVRKLRTLSDWGT